MHPKARHDGLLQQEIGDELIVYDESHATVHRLDPVAALVFRHCDGQVSLTQLATALNLDEGLISDAVAELAAAGLLYPSGDTPGSKREGGTARSLITSLVAPQPAAAFSF